MTRRRRTVASIVAAGVIVAACGDADDSADSLPSVEVIAADGAPADTADWTGEPLVVNFWFSTCPPCAKELRDFAAVDAERGDVVRFIGVNPIDEVDVMESFAAERGVEYDNFRDPIGDLQIELEITSFPTTVFVGSDGEVVERRGVLDADQLHEAIDELLAAE
ncbi:MAG: TlpA disulfide reductase family protein [Actinomycetota bacterium]